MKSTECGSVRSFDVNEADTVACLAASASCAFFGKAHHELSLETEDGVVLDPQALIAETGLEAGGVVRLLCAPVLVKTYAVVSTSFAVSESGARMAVGNADGTATMFDTTTGSVLWQTPSPSMRCFAKVFSIAFSTDEGSVAYGRGCDALLLNAHSGAKQCTMTLPPRSDNHVTAVCFAGERIFVGSSIGGLSIFESSGLLVRNATAHRQWVCRVACAGRWLFSCSSDNDLRRWDHDGVCVGVLAFPVVMIRDVAVGSGFVWCAAGHAVEKRCVHAERRKSGTLEGHTARVQHLATCEGADLVVSASGDDSTIRFWDADTCKELDITVDCSGNNSLGLAMGASCANRLFVRYADKVVVTGIRS